MTLRSWTLGALLAFAVPPSLATAQQRGPNELSREDRARARRHFDAGVQAFESRDFRTCVTEFEQALEIAGHPSVLENLARCHEELGEIDPAIRHYERYLDEQPDAADRAEIEARLADLRAREAPAPARHEPEPTREPPAAVQADVSAGGGQVLPWALLGSGMLAMGAGIVMIALDGTCASGSRKDAEGDCEELRDTGLGGMLLLAGGAVAAGVGGWLLLSASGQEDAAQAWLEDPTIRF